ncbi:MAG: GIY-YIG nuclease family protein [Patescibacteria group bacterium]
MIPATITILHNDLPDAPGVYFYYDNNDRLLYVGKATSLKKRVGSYFSKAHNARIADLVVNIARIDYVQTPTVIEALVLETNQIHSLQPPYNILSRDDKSFLYLCITNEEYPKPVLLRGADLERLGIKPFSKSLSVEAKRRFLAVFGPYISGRSLRMALDLVRKSIPWSTCEAPQTPSSSPLVRGRDASGSGDAPPPCQGGARGGRACFDAQIGRCPGVCTGAISTKEYRKIIRQLIQFFEGKKSVIVRQMTRDMRLAVLTMNFEAAAILRNKIFALEHIHDVALIMREDDWDVGANMVESRYHEPKDGHINVLGRIEAYDIANISGTSNVASMVVFENGQPKKEEYRKFRIKSFEGANDVGAMEEVIRRRLNRIRTSATSWPTPELMIIDGGEGQVNRVRDVLKQEGFSIPIIGIAKGFDRKQDRLVFDEANAELRRIAESSKEILQRARDEAHRFAGAYHRVLRARNSGIPKKKKFSL